MASLLFGNQKDERYLDINRFEAEAELEAKGYDPEDFKNYNTRQLIRAVELTRVDDKGRKRRGKPKRTGTKKHQGGIFYYSNTRPVQKAQGGKGSFSPLDPYAGVRNSILSWAVSNLDLTPDMGKIASTSAMSLINPSVAYAIWNSFKTDETGTETDDIIKETSTGDEEEDKKKKVTTDKHTLDTKVSNIEGEGDGKKVEKNEDIIYDYPSLKKEEEDTALQSLSKVLENINFSDFLRPSKIYSNSPTILRNEPLTLHSQRIGNMPGYNTLMGQTDMIPRVDTADYLIDRNIYKNIFSNNLFYRYFYIRK
jgi:hypothetical protein